MIFLQSFLPIVIYILLIVLLVILIVLGVKLLFTMNKIEKIVDNVNEKIERLNPIFNFLGYTSDRIVGIFDKVSEFITDIFMKLFIKNKNTDVEEDENE